MRAFINILPFFLLAAASIYCVADVGKLQGIYSTVSERSAIYGTFKVSDNNIHWTADAGSYVCKSKYKIIDHAVTKIYPEKYPFIEDEDGTLYEYYKIKLINKECPYDKLSNRYIMEKTESIQFVFRVNPDKYRIMKIITYDETGMRLG